MRTPLFLPRLTALITLMTVGITACNPIPPTTPPPTVSQSTEQLDQTTAEHRQLRDAIQKPIDQAKTAEAINLKAAEEQRKAIEDAGG